MRKFLMLLCLSALPAWSTPLDSGATHSLRFRTYPSSGVNATWDGLLSPHPLVAGRPEILEFGSQNSLRVTFSRPGFGNVVREITVLQAADTANNGTFPEEICLPANNVFIGASVWGSEHPLGALAIVLAFLAMPAVLFRVRSVWRGHREIKVRLEHYEALRDPGDSLLMQAVEGYVLVKPLGKGGMATVYKGVPLRSMDESQAVAVKILSREVMADRDFSRRFRREVKAYQNLEHPNVVRLISWSEPSEGSQDTPYIILELVQGETLGRRIGPNGMPWAQARPLLEQVFKAVQFAHSQGVVHRDLKPENVMVAGSRVKVMDFGLARNREASMLTASGAVLGTPAFMAPEQLAQGSSEPPVDQYALGVMTYQMLTGRLPQEADDMMQLFNKILTAAPVPPRQYRPNLSVALEAAMMQMLARDPGARFPSVQAAWEALAQARP